MRKQIVAGNWKMNKTASETESLLTELQGMLPDTHAEVLVAPTFVNLALASRQLEGSAIGVSAQNMHFADSGAFTGEISADMLLAIGVETVILGHSERREHFGEDDALLAKKVQQAVSKGMRIIFCFGELLDQRKAGTHFEVVASQLKQALFDLPEAAWKQLVLAYEPVWAIGTGETATPEQAQEMHAHIRNLVANAYTPAVADAVTILYGGSVKPGNAGDIFSKPDVDGGLIGGASLNAADFTAIVAAI
ncbi:triose-phosphate isomerase [Robiginitalea sp. M366]|uniref:triose-phosphate isomerase n=1 Tax=Robiginitalea aestuariiviva TaxID=3036903 RepID=UPI00240E8221|nr:triose-phosphate isomerase [Robiginitalea aestuariiviva]MDG1572240.1 triose-phosphate isomerase [Robiginitalea aestuariiviva]